MIRSLTGKHLRSSQIPVLFRFLGRALIIDFAGDSLKMVFFEMLVFRVFVGLCVMPSITFRPIRAGCKPCGSLLITYRAVSHSVDIPIQNTAQKVWGILCTPAF